MRKTLFLFLAFTIIAKTDAQNTSVRKSEIKRIQPAGKVHVVNTPEDFFPVLYSMEMPAPGSESYRRYLIDLKEKLYGEKKFQGATNFKTNADAPVPEILTAFEGNPMGVSVPNDNDLAISNDGFIISVINTSIYMFDQAGNTLKALSLATFSDTLNILGSKFDPKVLYDPVHDRFIIVFLNVVFGEEAANTHIVVAFSQSADPLLEWNLYVLPGNPKDNDTWTDFPMMAITEDELFITGNLIIPGEPWQTGFSETLIWQMNLAKGYAGDTLDAVFYDNLIFGDKPIRNMCPVKGGSTSYGPDMYLLSNRNFAETNDTIFIMRVTGKLDDPLTTVEIDFALTDLNYAVPPQARQYNSNTFDTNDGRVLGAFMENGMIQFVSNTLDPSTGFTGIYHGIITNLDGERNITAQIIGDDTLDFGYPNISYTGRFDNDDQCIITMDHSAPEVYAGMSAFYFSQGNYSDRVKLIDGETYVNVIGGTYERWGDYTGSQRKYNEPGVVWVSGNFGNLKDLGPFTNRENGTWIASLRSNDSLPPASVQQNYSMHNTKVFPNPADTYFETIINVPEGGFISCKLFDAQGRLITVLLSRQINAGNNKFIFSTAPLAAGIYFLQIEFNNAPYSNTQIIKN